MLASAERAGQWLNVFVHEKYSIGHIPASALVTRKILHRPYASVVVNNALDK
jgi:hypothetical protein